MYANELNSNGPTCRAGKVSTHASEQCKKNLFLQSLYGEDQNSNLANKTAGGSTDSQKEYQDKDMVDSLEHDVQFWTDYSKVHYHPQSLYELSGVWMDVEEFDNYGIGRDSFAWNSHGEEIGDRLRFFVEECDHIQVVYLLDYYLKLFLYLIVF